MSFRQLKLSVIAIFLFISTACTTNTPESVAVPLVKEVSAIDTEKKVFQEEQQPIKLAIASILSIRQTHHTYNKFANYLEEHLGRPVEIVQKHTYEEIKEAFEQGEIDVGIVCAYLSVIGNELGIFKKVAMPIRNGDTVFTSYTIVHKDSEFKSLEDLRSHSFAFSDPLSYSGFLFTNYEITKMGSSKNKFFSNTYFTYSHDNTILAVASGLVDGGSTHSDVYKQLKQENDPMVDKVKIIGEGPYVGNSPLVVSSNLDEQLIDRLVKVVLSMHTNEQGQKALRKLNVDYFQEPYPALYKPIREMLVELGEFQ